MRTGGTNEQVLLRPYVLACTMRLAPDFPIQLDDLQEAPQMLVC